MGKSIKTTLLLQPHVEDIDVSNIEKKLHNLQQQAKDMGFGDNIIEDIQKCIDKLDEYREDFKKLTSGKLDTDQFDEFKKSVDSTLSEVSERISDVEEKIENFTKVLKNIDGEAISKAFDNVKREFKSFKDNTKSAIKLLKDFQKLTNGYTGEKELRNILTTIEDINSASENFLNLKNVKASKKDLKSYENELTELYDKFTVLREIMSDPKTSVSVMKNAEKEMSEIIPKINELTKKIAKANKTSAAEFKDFNTGIKINSSLGVLDIDDILTQIDDEYDTLKKHLLMRSGELQEEVNKIKGSTTTANTFTFEKDGIKIPVMLSPEGLQKCKDDLDELITILKQQSENNPVDVSIRLFPLKSSKQDAKEVNKYIKDIRAQIPNEASGELKEKLNSFVDKFADEYQKALELNIKVNLSDTPKGVEEKVKAIQTAVNKNKIKIKPTFIIDKNQAQKLDDQFKEIRGDFTFDLTGQLDKMATSINEMLDNSNVDTWSSSFKTGLEKIKPVLAELNQLVAPLVELTTNKKQNRRGRPSNEDIANRNYVEKFTNAVDALNKALNLYDREIKHSEDIGNKLINSIQSDINSGDDYVLVPIEPDINGFIEKIEDALTSIKLNISGVTFFGGKGGDGTPITIVSNGETVVENNGSKSVDQKSEEQKKDSSTKSKSKSKTKSKADTNKWKSAETDGMDEEFANVYFGKGKRKRGTTQEKEAISEIDSIIGQYTNAIQNVMQMQRKIEKTKVLPGDSKAEKKDKSIENRDKSIERAVAKVRDLEEKYPILKLLNNKSLRQLSDYDKDVIRDNYLKNKGIERTKDYSANSYFAKLQQEVASKGKFNLNKSGNKQALTDIVQRFIGYKNRGGVGLLTHLTDDISVMNKIIDKYNKIMGITKKVKEINEETGEETERYLVPIEKLREEYEQLAIAKKKLQEYKIDQDFANKVTKGSDKDVNRVARLLKGTQLFKKRLESAEVFGLKEFDYGLGETESIEEAKQRLQKDLTGIAESLGLELGALDDFEQKTEEEIKEIAKILVAKRQVENEIAKYDDRMKMLEYAFSKREELQKEEAEKKKKSKEKKKTKPQKTKTEELEEETEDIEEETAEIRNKEAKEENKEAKEKTEKRKKILTGLEKKALNQRKRQEKNKEKAQSTLEFNRLKDVVAGFDDLDLRHTDVKQNFKDVASQFYGLKQKGLKQEITDLTDNAEVQKKLKKVYEEVAEAIRKVEEAEKSESESSKGKASQFLSEKNAVEKFTEAYEEYFTLREKVNGSDEKEKSKATTAMNKLLTKFPTLSSIGDTKKENLNFDEQLNTFMATQENLRKAQNDTTKAKEKDTKAEQDNIGAKEEGNKASDIRIAKYKTEKNAIKGFTEAYEKYFELREKVNSADEKGKTKATEKMDKLLGKFPTLSSIGDAKKEDINFDEQLKIFMATQDEIVGAQKKNTEETKENTKAQKENKKAKQDNANTPSVDEADSVKIKKNTKDVNENTDAQKKTKKTKQETSSTQPEFKKSFEIFKKFGDDFVNPKRGLSKEDFIDNANKEANAWTMFLEQYKDVPEAINEVIYGFSRLKKIYDTGFLTGGTEQVAEFLLFGNNVDSLKEKAIEAGVEIKKISEFEGKLFQEEKAQDKNIFQGLIDRISKYGEEKVKIGELKQIYKEYLDLVNQLPWDGENGTPSFSMFDNQSEIAEFFAKQLTKHGYKYDEDKEDFVKGKTNFGFDESTDYLWFDDYIEKEASARQKNAQDAKEETTAVKKSNEAKKENVGRQSIQSELQKIQGKYNSDSLYQSLLESGKVTKNSTIDEFTKYSEIGRNYSDEIYNLYRKNLQILETADKKSKEYNDALKMNRDLLIELSKFGMNADGERLWNVNQYASKSDKDILDDYNKAIKSENGQAKNQRTAQIRDALEARGYDVTGTDKEIYNRLRNASKQDTSNVDAQTDALEREKKEVSALIDELYRLKKIQDSLSIDDFLEGADITAQQVETGGQLYKYFGITDNPLDTINPDYFAKQYNEKYGEKYNLHDEGKKEASQWTEGVKEEIPNSENAGAKLADATAEGAMDASEEHSPSKVADRLGQYWGIGWKEGLEKTKPEIIAAITDLMDAAKAAAKGVEPLTEQDLKDALIDFGKDSTKWEDYNALRSPLRNILGVPKRVRTDKIKKYFDKQEAKEQSSRGEQPKQKVETTQQEAKAEEQKSKFIGLSKEQLQDCLAEEEKWLARCKEGSANYEKRKAAIEEIKSLMSGMDNTSTTEPPKPKAKEKVDLAEVSKKQISQILEKFENNEVDTLESFYKLDQIFERNTDVLEQMGKGEDAAEFKKQFEEVRKRILTELLRPIAQKYLGEDAEFNIKESVRRQGNKEGNPKFKSYRIQGEKDYVTVDPFGNLIGKDKNVNESLTQSKQAKKEAESLEKQVKKAEEDVQKAEENLEKSKKKLAGDKQKYQDDKEQKERDNLVKEYEKKAAQQQKENEQLERERTKAEEDVRKAQENLEKAQKKLAEDEQKYQDSKDQKNRNELTREYDKKETQQQRNSEQREKEIERARANAQKAQENLEKSEKKLSEDEQKYQDNKAQRERDALVKEYEKKTTQQQKEIEQREKEIEKSRAEVQKAQEALEKAQKRQSEIEEEKQRKADRQKYDKMYADYDKKEQQQKVEAEGQRQAQINSILDERLNAYKEIWNINKEISKLNPTTDAKQISELEKQRQDYGDIFTSATRLLNVLDKQAITEDHINQLLKIRESAVNEINRRQSAQEDNLTKEAVKEQEQRSKKYLGLQGRLGSASYDLNFELGNGNPTPEFAEKLQNTLKDISVLTDEIKKKGIDAVSEQDIKRAEELLETVRQIRKEGKLTENRKANENSIQKNLAQINGMLSDNTKWSFKRTDVYKDLVNLQERFKNFDTSRPQSELAELTTELLKTKARFEELDNTVKGKNLFQTFIERIHGTTAQLVAQYLSWMDIIRYIRTMATTIIDLDTQLVDLRKTTTMTTSELNEFYNASSDIAKTLGVTTSEIISQSAAWSRLGYSSKEAATQMAQLSSKFASISPGMTTENSTDYLVSTMQANIYA